MVFYFVCGLVRLIMLVVTVVGCVALAVIGFVCGGEWVVWIWWLIWYCDVNSVVYLSINFILCFMLVRWELWFGGCLLCCLWFFGFSCVVLLLVCGLVLVCRVVGDLDLVGCCVVYLLCDAVNLACCMFA